MLLSTIIKLIIYLVLLCGPILLVYYLYKLNSSKKKIEWMRAQKYITLHILVPKENEKTPVAAEQLFASIHGIFRTDQRYQEQISFEIASKSKFIHFYTRVPENLKDFIEGQIYAQYPTVEIVEVEDYSKNISPSQKSYGCELLLVKPEVYPIKTFVNFDVDPLAAITSVIAKVQDNEEVWVQIIVRPTSDKWQSKGIAHIENAKSGDRGNFWAKIIGGIINFFVDIISTAVGRVSSSETTPASHEEKKLSGIQEAGLKEVEKKVTKLGFETKIRIIVLSDDEISARAKVAITSGVFKQYNTINLNGFQPSKISSGYDFLQAFQNREFYDNGYILNIEELASLFHLPSVSVSTPNIVWAGSKKGEPPANLPIEGMTKSDELTIFAKSDFRHMVHRFGIKKADRRLHLYTIGKTGTGKSTMLENMTYDDIKKGRGVAVVDPHGELINHILDFIPPERINDVVYFNPADRDWPIGFNLLENVEPDLKNIVASGVVGILKKIFTSGTTGTASWGPRLEYILRNVILALLDYPNATMLGIMRLLVDKDYRKKVLEKVKDPVIRDFFINEFEKYDPKFRTEAIAPIQNKVGQFLSSSTIRNIVGQPKSTIDIEKIMNEGKILLVDLSIGRIGEDNSALLGAMLITKIQLAAMRRVIIAEDQRKDFYLYVDEFQNFATDSFAIILSEARKYHLNLIMTNQYIAQVPETVAKAIFGNVGTVVSFRVGVQDAAELAKEFEPVFLPNDLVNLGNYHVYIKMAIDGVTRPAFSAITLPPIQKNIESSREKIIEVSRERYAKSRGVVEEKIKEWSYEQKHTTIESHFSQKEKDLRNMLYEERKKSMIVDRPITKNSGKYDEVYDKKGKRWYVAKEGGISKKYSQLISFGDIEEITKNLSVKNNKIRIKSGESVKLSNYKKL